MSRYLILLILNGPFIVAGLVNALVAYKMTRISKRRFILQVAFWIILLTGLATIKPIYEFLFSNNLTNTEPLSLFDVMQITGIVIVFFIAIRTRAKVENLERRLQDLHQELSIRLSQDETNSRKPTH
ncbi:MAG: hypothetical protein ACQR33_06545 [Candidatus Saccharibacteria bacterium]